jgi:hypothetical protein
MKKLICIQSSCDYSFINICDFKATHKQVIVQDMRFYHWIVTNIWEKLAAPHNSNVHVSRAFFTYHPQSPTNIVASKDKMSPFRVPTKRPPFMVCQRAPCGEIPAFRTCVYISLRISPIKKPSLQVLLTVVPLRVTHSYQNPLCPSLKVSSKWPHPLMERGTHLQCLTLHILQGSQKGTLPHGAPIDKAGVICFSKFPINVPPFKFPSGAPMERDALLYSLLLRSSQSAL